MKLKTLFASACLLAAAGATAGPLTSESFALTASREQTTRWELGSPDRNVPKATAGNADGAGVFRLYEQFILPNYTEGLDLATAVLSFTYRTYSPSWRKLEVFGTSGNWQFINFYTAPSANTGVLGTLPANSYSWTTATIDITDHLNSILHPGGAIGFMIKSPVEHSNFMDFSEFSSVSMSLNFEPPAGADPEPGTPGSAVSAPGSLATLLLGLALMSINFCFRRQTGSR